MAGIAVSRSVFVWAPPPAKLTPVLSATGAQIWQHAAARRYPVGISIGPAAGWYRLVSLAHDSYLAMFSEALAGR